MGMDVYGKKPKNEKGKYFRNNVWWWHPLWEYVEYAFPDIAEKVPYAHSNDGDGLGARDAKILAVKLRKNLKDGKVAEYALERQQILDTAKLEHEEAQKQKAISEGKSLDNFEPEHFWAGSYHFNEENVIEFTEFLENCGGFQIC